MTAPIPEGLIKRQEIADAYADIATTENTQPMALSGLIVPVVNLPQKPPPARSGFYPVTVGGSSSAAVGFISNVGINNSEDFSRVILEVYAVTISNTTGADRSYHLRRQDSPITGVTFLGALVSYIDAGPGGVLSSMGRMTRNNSATAQGAFMADLRVNDGETHTFPIECIINSGTLWVSGPSTNQEVRAAFHARVFPLIFPQLPG